MVPLTRSCSPGFEMPEIREAHDRVFTDPHHFAQDICRPFRDLERLVQYNVIEGIVLVVSQAFVDVALIAVQTLFHALEHAVFGNLDTVGNGTLFCPGACAGAHRHRSRDQGPLIRW